MSPLTPRLIICGFFGLFNGLLSYILLPDIPDAPRWSLISGLTTFGVLLLIMTIREDSRIRRYTRAEKLLPTAPTFTMGANFRQGRKAASVNVYLCGSEIILIDVSGREPVLTRLPRHELRSLTFVPPVELRLEKYDGSRLLLLSNTPGSVPPRTPYPVLPGQLPASVSPRWATAAESQAEAGLEPTASGNLSKHFPEHATTPPSPARGQLGQSVAALSQTQNDPLQETPGRRKSH